jgi:polysaccharide biosynthesis/export protein
VRAFCRFSKALPRRALTLLLAAASAAILAACTTTPGAIKTDAAHVESAQTVGADYVIGPGDTLKITVLRSPDLDAEVPVRPDGKISTPLVNDMVAVGKSPTQLSRDMEKVLSEFVREPTVSVIVTKATSTRSQVMVVGQAVAPKPVPYHSGMNMLELMSAVGGLSQFAAGNRAKIIRRQGQKVEEIRVRLNNLMKGDIRENILLQPGDILVIPETWF